MSVMHERRAGLGGLRNEYARGPLREQIAQTDGVPKGLCLRESSSRLERHLL